MWRERLDALGKGLKIGLAWRGGAVSTRRALRSLALTELSPLLGIEGCHFIDLQYGDTAQERMDLRQAMPAEFHRWPEAIEDLDHCAAVISNLDLVISVCTTLVHLAGAVGQPVWVLVPRIAEWRYLSCGERMPWYPSASLIRQTDPGDWVGAVQEVERRLRSRLATR
jgi:hypothetical protein